MSPSTRCRLLKEASMRLLRFGGIAFCAALVISLRAGADDAKKAAIPKKAASMADHILTPDMLKFTPAPPVLPAGCEVAGLNGDMSKKGSEYTVRLRVPDGWKIPPHFHPAEEHVTVIQGAFWMGMGQVRRGGAQGNARRRLPRDPEARAPLRNGEGPDHHPTARRRAVGHHVREPVRRPEQEGRREVATSRHFQKPEMPRNLERNTGFKLATFVWQGAYRQDGPMAPRRRARGRKARLCGSGASLRAR